MHFISSTYECLPSVLQSSFHTTDFEICSQVWSWFVVVLFVCRNGCLVLLKSHSLNELAYTYMNADYCMKFFIKGWWFFVFQTAHSMTPRRGVECFYQGYISASFHCVAMWSSFLLHTCTRFRIRIRWLHISSKLSGSKVNVDDQFGILNWDVISCMLTSLPALLVNCFWSSDCTGLMFTYPSFRWV